MRRRSAPSTTASRGGEVRFNAADGTKLVGHSFGKGTTAVILTHQSEGDLCDWLPYAKRLASKGYFAFPIDFRGYGLSDGPTPAPYRYSQDIAAAAKALRKLGKKKIFVVGASMGGLAAVVAGANVTPPLAGVVSVSSPARFRGMDGVKAGPRLRVPMLYLAATADDNAGFDFSKDAETLHRAAATKDKRLELLPGSLHGIALVGGSARAKSVDRGLPQSALGPPEAAPSGVFRGKCGALAPAAALAAAAGNCASHRTRRGGRRVEPVRGAPEGARDPAAGRARRDEPMLGSGGQPVLLPILGDLGEKVRGGVHRGS